MIQKLDQLRGKMGMVFQSFNLFFLIRQSLKISQLQPVKVKNINEKEAAKTAMELLKKVGLSDKAQAISGSTVRRAKNNGLQFARALR